MPMNDPDEIARQAARLVPGIFLLSLFVRAMIGVGVTELALGKRTGLTLVYFSLGNSVWRLLGAWILFFLVMILIYIALIIFTVVVAICGGLAIKAAALPQSSNAVAIGLLAIFCGFLFVGSLIYILARLTFLIPPVVVNEQKVDLARGWQLTKGNFWRIFLIGLLLFLPLIVVGMVVFFAVFGTAIVSDMLQVFTMAMHNTKQDIIQQHVDAMGASMRAQSLAIWPYTMVANILLGAFYYGLMYSASVFAYRAVTETSAPTPQPMSEAPAGHG
jgi:hypothetical protein